MLMPCADWVEKLVFSNSDDLTYSQRIALNEHLASCPACATAYSAYRVIAEHISSLPAVEPLVNLPYDLLADAERSINRKEQIICMSSSILTWLKSLMMALTHLLLRVSYVSDSHYCYALRDDSGFLLWKYKKTNVFFSCPAVKDGAAYVTPFDAQVFLLGSRLRIFGNSFLWRQ
jgi:hypothetical protein